MEVLQPIHSNGLSQNSVDLPYHSQGKAAYTQTAEAERLLESDEDEDDAEKKRIQFGSHLASFSFRPGSIALQSSNSTTSRKESPCRKTIVCSASPVQISTSSEKMSSSPEVALASLSKRPDQASCSTKHLPDLPNSLAPSLREFQLCPLCLQPFPVLTANDSATKKPTSKKAKIGRAITGAARLTHLQLCAFRSDTPAEVVMSLMEKEKVRLDRNQRKEYNEAINKQGIWSTLTGDAPPSTQVQIESIQSKRRRKGMAVMSKAAEAKGRKGKKAPPAAVTFKAGKRGGLNRASTLIKAPGTTRAEVKRRCIELFGLPIPERKSEADKSGGSVSLYEDHDETTHRCKRAASITTIHLGLGVGACSPKAKEDSIGPTSRLGMGSGLGFFVAQRFKSSD